MVVASIYAIQQPGCHGLTCLISADGFVCFAAKPDYYHDGDGYNHFKHKDYDHGGKEATVVHFVMSAKK